jgi:hypothetical protein
METLRSTIAAGSWMDNSLLHWVCRQKPLNKLKAQAVSSVCCVCVCVLVCGADHAFYSLPEMAAIVLFTFFIDE